MNYTELIISGYNGQRTTPFISFFKQQAQIAKRDNFVEFADFFNGCKGVVSDWKRSITSWCDRSIGALNGSINYWQNLFIYDDREWAKRVKENGGIVDDYSLNRHHEEQKVDKMQKVKELEQKKEEWEYEKHSIEIYLDDYTVKWSDEERSFFENTPERQYITLNYNILVALENALLQAEQELNPTSANTPTELTPPLPNTILQALQQTGFIENAAAQPLKWIKSNSTTHGKIPNKKSLLDLLCLLEYPDNVIKNRTMLNTHFTFLNEKPLTAQNYTYITDQSGNIKRPIVSEYHNDLKNIINKSKEK
jgi:hypothetical protein